MGFLSIHIISSIRRGGRERQLASILKYSNSDFDSKAIVFNKSENSYEKEYEIFDQLIYLESKGTFARIVELLKIVKREQPTIIWSWGGFEATLGLIVSVLTRVKHINGSVRHGIVLNNSKHLWRKFILHLSPFVVANSKAGLRANGLKRGYVLYNGLDEKFFDGSNRQAIKELPPDLNDRLKPGVITMISVANLVPFKDYSTILSALNRLKKNGINFQYIIIGEGPERTRIEEEISKNLLSDRVFLLGRRQDVSNLLLLSDIFVHSSRGEGCSNAILEAMANGLPLVASDTGGTNEIVKPSFGLLFEFGNSEQLTAHLQDLISHPEKISAMKIKAREYAQAHFSMDEMMKNYYSIVEKVCNS